MPEREKSISGFFLTKYNLDSRLGSGFSDERHEQSELVRGARTANKLRRSLKCEPVRARRKSKNTCPISYINPEIVGWAYLPNILLYNHTSSSRLSNLGDPVFIIHFAFTYFTGFPPFRRE